MKRALKFLVGTLFVGAFLPWAASAKAAYEPEAFMAMCEADGDDWHLQAAACLILTTLTADRDDLARTFYNRGNALEELREYEAAIRDYDLAVRIRPGYTDAIVNRGLTYRRMGDSDRAVEDYDLALTMDPDHRIARINRGYVFLQQDRFPEAIADFDHVLRADPANAFALNNRGLAFWELGDMDRAVADFTASLESEPGDPRARQNRGLLYSSMGRDDLAIEDFRTILQVTPGFSEARSELADILAFGDESLRNLEEALAHKMILIAARPDDVDLRYDVAVILTWLGKTEIAIAEHRKIADAGGYAPEYQNGLVKMGYLNPDDATGDWNAASEAALTACVSEGCLPLEY
ncbi:MAG: tetratricopeptide repeat protein [Minwuia sp.]|uniref:tetratricopeptide repeat protein n=1 Tax=Minwuia sp. TaxID=2493630 RepID=UPI003A845790